MLVPRQGKGGYVDPTIPNPGTDDDSRIIIYGYTPTLALNILALVLYALLAILYTLHLYPWRSSSRPFTILLVIAILFEIIGYAFRLQSSPPPVGDPYKTINFIIQYFFIVVAPVFISAGIYTILTSLIRHVGEDVSSPFGIKRRAIVWVFVVCDVVATVVQIVGAALIGSAESNGRSPKTPNDILLAGLAFQVFSFLVFLILLGVFIAKTKGLIDAPDLQPQMTKRLPGTLKAFIWILVSASLLIYLRTIFRLAETAQGVYGFAMTHEAFFGALEFAPVVAAVTMLGLWHPGVFVGRRKGGDERSEAAEQHRDRTQERPK